MFKSLVIRSLVLAIGLFFTVAARAATITVTSNGDTIAVNANVTLREALSSINNGANVNADVVPVGAYGTNDTINFNITPAGFFLINILGSSLPTIVKPITIDGSTQGGSVQNTAVTGDNSTHNIMLNCSSVNSCTDGLTLGQGSAGSTIRFLIFDSAPGSGLVVNSANNIIAGNWVGLDSAGGGTPSAGNGTGINVFSAGPPQDVSGNVIGGMNPQDRNVIANNTAQQLALARLLVGGLYGGGSNIVVQNNYVGTDKAGTTGLLNGGGGIRMTDLLNATIGGASNSLGVSCVAPCNLIAGNSQQPLSTNTNTNSTNNTGYLIQGNFFGTNVTGTAGVTGGNGASAQAVIELAGAGTVMIGGTAAGTGNLISGFSTARPGILVDTGVVGPVTIQGNFIGTTTTGNAALGNGGPGIDILGATNVTIGGTLPAARNVIGGNGNGMSPKGPGILVEGNPPFSTGTAVIQGNNIGIGANGSSNIGNIGDGIDFASGATGSTVGASSSGGAGANIIAFNGAGRTNGAGVGVPNGSATNKIFSNSIFSNTGSSTGIGIDLSAGGSATDGPTANDACDGDAGGNNLQNFPVLTSAQSTGSSITIAGILNSTASTTFTIEFFSNPAGTSQGRTFLGSTSTTTNGACSGAFNAVLAQTVSAGLNITAAATDPSGNTSEFSAAVASTATLTAANATVTGRISDNFGNAIAGVSIRLNGTQTRLTITDGNGNYGFDGVETNGIYAVTPSRANYLFNPANRSFSSLGAHTEASFTGTTNGDHANAIDTNEFFVRQQYLDFLGREPDPPGFNGWMNTLTNCAAGDTSCDRVHVSEMFYRSAEFQERGYFAYRFYATALGRKPDYLEFTPDLQRVGGFLTQDQLTAAKNLLALDFVARPEFVSRYGSLSNPAYVDQLLNTAGVTLANRQSLIDSLTNGTATRAQVLQEISESGDVYRKFYNQAFVVMEYFGYLHRDPDELYTNWIAELDRTGNPRQMVEGFVNSVEYRNRFVP